MMYLWMSRLDLYGCCLLDAGSDSSPEYDPLDTSVLIIFILFIPHITQYNKIYYTSFDVMMRTFSKVLYILLHTCTMILYMIHIDILILNILIYCLNDVIRMIAHVTPLIDKGSTIILIKFLHIRACVFILSKCNKQITLRVYHS